MTRKTLLQLNLVAIGVGFRHFSTGWSRGHLRRARALLALNDLSGAEKSITTCLEIEPHNQRALETKRDIQRRQVGAEKAGGAPYTVIYAITIDPVAL